MVNATPRKSETPQRTCHQHVMIHTADRCSDCTMFPDLIQYRRCGDIQIFGTQTLLIPTVGPGPTGLRTHLREVHFAASRLLSPISALATEMRTAAVGLARLTNLQGKHFGGTAASINTRPTRIRLRMTNKLCLSQLEDVNWADYT